MDFASKFSNYSHFPLWGEWILRANFLTILAFPFGESGFCERSEQKTREVLFAKNIAGIKIVCVNDRRVLCASASSSSRYVAINL